MYGLLKLLLIEELENKKHKFSAQRRHFRDSNLKTPHRNKAESQPEKKKTRKKKNRKQKTENAEEANEFKATKHEQSTNQAKLTPARELHPNSELGKTSNSENLRDS